MSDPVAFDRTFRTVLVGDMGPHRWTCAVLDDSVRILGSGRAVKVAAEVEGVTFTTSMLPYRGDHMLPVKQAVLDAIGRTAGDAVTVRITTPGA